jgi:hypothetical protein
MPKEGLPTSLLNRLLARGMTVALARANNTPTEADYLASDLARIEKAGKTVGEGIENYEQRLIAFRNFVSKQKLFEDRGLQEFQRQKQARDN